MRVVQYVLRNEVGVRRVGVRLGEEIIDVASIKKGLPDNLLALLASHKPFLDELET